jgi:hypothetical protein
MTEASPTQLDAHAEALPPAGETLDAASRLFRRSLAACLPWSMLGVLAGQMGTAYDLSQHGAAGFAGARDPVWWLLSLGGGVVNLLLWALVMRRQYAMLQGRSASWGADALDLLRRLPSLLATVLLGLALIAVGTVLLIVPGVYLASALIFAFPAAVLEGLGPLAAMDRALRLVRRRWWHSTAISSVGFLAVLVVLAIGIVLGVIAGGLITGGNFDFALVVASISTTLLAALIAPFLLALCTRQFLDLRRSGG